MLRDLTPDLGGKTSWVVAFRHTYVPDVWQSVYVNCQTGRRPPKRCVWEIFLAATPSLGYDPARVWGSVKHAEFGVLRLEPGRVLLGDKQESRLCRARARRVGHALPAG